MLQHLTSSGRKSACLILVLWLCQAKLSPTLLCYRDSLRAPGAGSLWARCARTRAASRGRAEHPPHQCSVFGKMGHSVSHRWWGNEATLSVMLGFWSKSHRKILLHSLPSLDPDEDFKIFLGPKLFLKLLIKCFSENAEADKLIKGKQQFLLYQEAQKMNVSLTLSLKTMWEFFSLYLKQRWHMSYGQWYITQKISEIPWVV